MRLAFLPVLLSLALGQGLKVVGPGGEPTPRVAVRTPLEILGEGLPEGRYSLLVEGPEGPVTLEVEAQGGGFRLPFTPQSPGAYRVRLSLPSGALETGFSASLPQEPALTEEGLRLPGGLLPLPKGPWVGPLVQGERAYLAQGLLVLEVPLENPQGVRFHFAPRRVVALRPGPEAVLEGERVLPLPFPPLPFEGSWAEIQGLRPLLEALNPPKPWPYFAYWALPPETLTPEDLEAYGRDLQNRGHQPELLFAQEGVRRMAEAALALRAQDPGQAQALTETLLRYTPLFPGSLAFFQAMAEYFAAQNRPELALRLEEALVTLRTWLPPSLRGLPLALGVLGLAYLALFLYLFLYPLPVQMRDLRPIGGYLGGFFRHPLVRLRHLHLAYAGLGERLLALFLLLGFLLGLLLYGLDQRARQALLRPPLDRGTLRTEAVGAWLQTLPPLPGVQALRGYALLASQPQEARTLLQASPYPFAQAPLGGEGLVRAYGLAPYAGPIRSALGLGEDLWGSRAMGPSLRTLYLVLLEVEWRRFWEDPLRNFLALPLPIPPNLRLPLFALGFFLLLYHLLAFFLPPKGGRPAPAYGRLIRLLFPGSLGFGSGLGILLLLLLAYGLLLLLQGGPPWPLLLAYSLHLLLLPSWRRLG